VVSPECYIDTYLSSSIFNRPAQLSLYPNPARNVFSFQINPGGQGVAFITLTDTSGRTIKQWKMNYVNGENNLTFGITNVEAGIYMVQMTLSESRRRYTGKLVVID
ncbi:MAG TPA: T9SS type A sorting domain-containing protein, partial [Saprospiraceae bacterium]|nr:T9SS type A sorting domain-containing protein [Saprospiraceae bacterium]